MKAEEEIVLGLGYSWIWRDIIWWLVSASAPESLIVTAYLFSTFFGSDSAVLAKLRIKNILKFPLIQNERVNGVSVEQTSSTQNSQRKRVKCADANLRARHLAGLVAMLNYPFL